MWYFINNRRAVPEEVQQDAVRQEEILPVEQNVEQNPDVQVFTPQPRVTSEIDEDINSAIDSAMKDVDVAR